MLIRSAGEHVEMLETTLHQILRVVIVGKHRKLLEVEVALAVSLEDVLVQERVGGQREDGGCLLRVRLGLWILRVERDVLPRHRQRDKHGRVSDERDFGPQQGTFMAVRGRKSVGEQRP